MQNPQVQRSSVQRAVSHDKGTCSDSNKPCAGQAPSRQHQPYQRTMSMDKTGNMARSQGEEMGKQTMSRSFKSNDPNIYTRQFQKTMFKDSLALGEYFSRVGKTGYSRTCWGGFYRRW